MSTITAKGVGPVTRVTAGNALSVTLTFSALDFDGANGVETSHVELHRSVAGRNAWVNVQNYPTNVDVAGEQFAIPAGGLSYDFRIVVPFVVDSGDVAETLVEVAITAVEDLATQAELDAVIAATAPQPTLAVPGYDVADRDALDAPVGYAEIFNLDTSLLEVWDGASWNPVGAGTPGALITAVDTVPGDWDANPGTVQAGLDALAARTTVLEGASSGSEYVYAVLGSQGSVGVNAANLMQLTAHPFDSLNDFDTTNKRFTPQLAGKWLVHVGAHMDFAGVATPSTANVTLRKNGATVAAAGTVIGTSEANPTLSAIVSLNGSTDYIDVTTRANGAAGSYTVIAGDNAPASGDSYLIATYLGA